MSDNPKDKDPIETSDSGESRTSDQLEAKPNPSTESAAAALDPSKVAVSEELMAKIVNLCEKNSEATLNLNTKLQDLTEKLSGIRREIDDNKPLYVEAKVTGFYNYDKKTKEIVDEYELGEKQRAKHLFDRVRSKYPSA